MSQKFAQRSPQRFGSRPFQGKSFMEQQRNRVVSQEQEQFTERRKPLGAVYADAGKEGAYTGWMLRYQRPEKLGRIGMFATDFGREYRLSYGDAKTVQALKSDVELEGEREIREFQLWKMITGSSLSSSEKEQLITQVWPFTEQAFAEAHGVEASHRFYRDLGYSQFGGKYAPFTVPTGAKIKSITETGEGLKVEYEQPVSTFAPTTTDEGLKLPKALGSEKFLTGLTTEVQPNIVQENWLSDWLYSVKLGTVIDPMASLKQGKLVGVDVRPFAPLAGFITPFEWATYEATMILRGGKGAIGTPPQTPTFTQMVVSGTSKDYPSYYVSGSLLGELAFSEFLGKAFGIGVEGVKNVVYPLGTGVKATGHLAKDYVTGTQTFKDWQLAGRGLAEGLIGEEPYMYMKNVLAPTVKGVYAPEIASTIRNQLAVFRGVPKQMFEGTDIEEIVLYRRGILFNQPVTSMISSSLVTEDLKLAARGLAEGFIGPERYSYLKSVAIPMMKEIYIPEASQKISTFLAVLHGVPAEAIKGIPNPIESWQMYRSGVLFNEPFVSITFSHIAKPQDVMFLKSVFAPNIKEYFSLKMPSMTVDSEAWRFLTEPAKTAKAYGKVVAGKIRYSLNWPVESSDVFEHTPLVFDAPMETGKHATQYMLESSQVALTVRPGESLSVTGMPKMTYAYPFMFPSQRQREEDEIEYTVLSYPTKGAMVVPLLDMKAYSTSSSRLVEFRTGKTGSLSSLRIGSLSIGKVGSLGIAKTHLTMMPRSNVFTSSRASLKQVQPQQLSLKQVQLQLLSQQQSYMQKTLQKTKLSRRDFETKRKQPKKKAKQEKIKGLGAYKRKYPLATAEEFVRTFI